MSKLHQHFERLFLKNLKGIVMKHVVTFIALLLGTIGLSAQSFDRYFIDKTLRVDYYHTGTKGADGLCLCARTRAFIRWACR